MTKNICGTEPAADADLLRRLEKAAVEMAGKAGSLVLERFGGAIKVGAKDEAGRDLVTDVDRASQHLIEGLLADEFPGHMLLGEEEAPAEEAPAPDFVWAVDPIDGTINFVNGLPLYSVSVGVLHRGRPVAAAVWLPWPSAQRSRIAHARKGGGAWLDGERLRIEALDGDGAPVGGRVSAVPALLAFMYRVGAPLRRALGEPRALASASYEGAMTAAGMVQYAVLGPARTWDFAAVTLLASEAGGATVSLEDGRWTPLETFAPGYSNTAEASRRLRSWRQPVIMGPPATVAFVSANLRPRKPSLRARARRMMRRPSGRSGGG